MDINLFLLIKSKQKEKPPFSNEYNIILGYRCPFNKTDLGAVGYHLN